MPLVKVSYKNIALGYLGKAKESRRIYFDIIQNSAVNLAFQELGLKPDVLFPEGIQELGGNTLESSSELDLLNYITRLNNRLSKVTVIVEDAIELASRPSPPTEPINQSRNSLLEEARRALVDFRKEHRHVSANVSRAHWHFVLYYFSVMENSLTKQKSELKDSIDIVTNESIEKLSMYERDILNRTDIKSRTLDVRLDEIKKELSSQEDKITNTAQELMEKLDKNFSTQQSANLEAVTDQARESVNQIQLASQEAANKFHKQVDSQISEINKRIDNEVNQFEAHKLDIEKILGDISHAHQSNANRIQADKEQETADSLRKWGVTGLILMIIFSLYLFDSYLGFFGTKTTTDDQLTSQWFLVRFLTITLLTGPFIYLLKESASHRSKENLYRQRGTQLSSIGAYLAELEMEERAILKKDLARNFFSLHDGKVDTQNVPDLIRDMKQIIGLAKSINGHPKTMRERFTRK
ncbi:hypothetical protein BBM84_14915 [Vibrio parahaemolyticus]|uniref:hypothetical protein n=1 Tax=Vibrio parahaemolyticus TaxID=670 RepID=UPI00084AA103|nr:hypothetical protein [Vibrio parahaemolyticus]OEA17017.1 hypothetical protein BBM56_13820 [Vibrio parahaemolyticus]OEB62207.1 hypothetical protein BBM84_14915 [Vibrio parahaemolyticus]